jgi:hypothetical protein
VRFGRIRVFTARALLRAGTAANRGYGGLWTLPGHAEFVDDLLLSQTSPPASTDA